MGITMAALFYAIMLIIISSLSMNGHAQMDDPSLYLFRNCKYDKIYQFGDSLSDTGNINVLDNNGPSSRPPYGYSYFKEPTGRCSNGLLMIDYIAMAAGLPFPSPYKVKNATFKNGVNFAVASSTAMSLKQLAHMNVSVHDTTSNSSLYVQVDWMADYLKSYCKPGPDCEKKLSNSLFMMGETGGNDVNAALNRNASVQEIKALVPDIVDTIMHATKRIIKFGARTVVIPGNLPIGCLPVYLARFNHPNATLDKNHCLKKLNHLAKYYNNHLKKEIEKLRHENRDKIIVYGDLYNAVEWLLPRAPYLGFERKSLLKACCGDLTGKYNVGGYKKFCGYAGYDLCSNPDAHFSWDGIHPTQAANKYLSTWLINNMLPMLDCPV